MAINCSRDQLIVHGTVVERARAVFDVWAGPSEHLPLLASRFRSIFNRVR